MKLIGLHQLRDLKSAPNLIIQLSIKQGIFIIIGFGGINEAITLE
jgi:hypothetical protein